MDRTADRIRVAGLLLALAFFALASATPAFAYRIPHRTLAQGDGSPLPLSAPWPAGQVWMAGNGGYYYGMGTHQGAEQYAVDFNRVGAEDNGQPIYAAADGVVVSAGRLDGYGNCVVLAHRFGLRTTYAHFLLPPSVIVGQRVTTRTVLGFCGSTGNSTGPHLHFSLRRGSVSLRPEPMEGRVLSDGILLMAGLKTGPSDDVVVLADLVRTPSPQAGSTRLAEDVYGPLAGDADRAMGGRQGVSRAAH